MNRTAQQIGHDIILGDKTARRELEKMFGKPIDRLTQSEMKHGLIVLSAFEQQWNKKLKQIAVTAITLTAVALIALAGCNYTPADESAAERVTTACNEYPAVGIVTATDAERDTVTVSTASGIEYEFRGIEDWMQGDLASMIMYDAGTSGAVLDDEITAVRYAGTAEMMQNRLDKRTIE